MGRTFRRSENLLTFLNITEARRIGLFKPSTAFYMIALCERCWMMSSDNEQSLCYRKHDNLSNMHCLLSHRMDSLLMKTGSMYDYVKRIFELLHLHINGSYLIM